ncbi:MAG: hypothetical protein K6F52_04700 [Clostridia bacterium]|nr:hypothetical protein [Clostridia bacterium]
MATRTISTKLAIEGEQEYRQKVSMLNSELAVMESELKKVSSAYIGEANTAEALEAKEKALTNAVQAQEKVMAEQNAAYNNAITTHEKYKKELEEIEKKLSESKTKYNSYTESEKQASKEAKELEAEIKKLEAEHERLNGKTMASKKGADSWQQSINKSKK